MSENVLIDPPKPKEYDFVEQIDQWLRSLPPEDYNKFMNGVSLDTVLILFKHFPDNSLIKETLQEMI